MKSLIVVSLVISLLCGSAVGVKTPSARFSQVARSLIQPKPSEEFRVVCVTSDTLSEIGELNEDDMVNSLCTDLLVHPDSSDWEHANIHAQPPRRFQARHQLVRLHLSVPDSHLSTTSASEMFHLVAYLSNAHASGLNVEVSSSSNPGVLLHVLKALHDALVGMELSVSIPSSWTQVDPYILDLVDYVLAVPPMASSKDSGKTVDSGSFVKSWLDSGFHAGKLIVGLPSAVYSSTDKEAKIPSHRLDELCNGTNLISWIPKRTQDDQLLWHKHNVNGEFRMLMGSSVEQQVAEIRRQNLAGVFLFDHESLHDRYVVNPICRRHRSLFTRSVHRAVHEHNQPKALDDTVVTSLPEWKLIGGRNGGGRLGHVLVYATPSQEEEFITYFNITNDATLLASPVEHVVLGYDKQGHIYNLHRPRCGGDGIDDEMLEELIQRYSLDIVASWRQPPPVLIFPGATNSSAELLRPHAVPILITWFKKFLLPRNTHRVHHQEECHGQHVTNWLPRRLSVAIPDSSSPPDSVLPIETETITVVSEIPTTVTTTEATTTTTESPTTKTTEPLIISYEATTMAGTEAPTTIRFVETDPEDETPFLTTRRPGLRPSDLQSIMSQRIDRFQGESTASRSLPDAPLTNLDDQVDYQEPQPEEMSGMSFQAMKKAIEDAYRRTYDKFMSIWIRPQP